MISITTYSEAGGHAVNEDAFAIDSGDDWVICTLADGQGGQSGGGRAAKLACETVMMLARPLPVSLLCDDCFWLALLHQADKTVADDKRAGLTTLIALSVVDGKVYGASNGNSAVLLMDSNNKAAELSRHQSKNPPIGSSVAACTTFETVLTQPWKLLVMSDGVWKHIGWQQLRDIAHQERGQSLVDRLVLKTKGGAGGKLQDDFTLVVFEQD